jgi:WD40 repeat protein
MTLYFVFSQDSGRLITSTETVTNEGTTIELRSWPVEGGGPDLVALLTNLPESFNVFPAVDPTGARVAWADGRRVHVGRVRGSHLDPEPEFTLEHDTTVAAQIFGPEGRQLATADTAGAIRIWSLESDPPARTHTLSGPGGVSASVIGFDRSGTMFASAGSLWDLTGPPDAEPLRIRGGYGLAFHPKSRWIASSGGGATVTLWPLARSYPQILEGHEEMIMGLAFTPDGRQLVSASEDGSVRVWPLVGGADERSRVLHQAEGSFAFPLGCEVAPDGSFVVTGDPQGRVSVLPFDGGPARELSGFTDSIYGLVVGPRSRLVAAGAGGYNRDEAFVRVWDLETGETKVLDAGDGVETGPLEFTPGGDLWVVSRSMLRRWELDGLEPRIVEEIDLSRLGFELDGGIEVDADGRRLLLGSDGRVFIHELDSGESRVLSSHPDTASAHLDSVNDLVITSEVWGPVRVGPASGEEPHLLLGHERTALAVAVSPDGRWVATGANDNTIRLWPVPDFSKPPLHTLPREELIAKLKSLTNVRVVRDPESPTGWDTEIGPFPGWETVPSW